MARGMTAAVELELAQHELDAAWARVQAAEARLAADEARWQTPRARWQTPRARLYEVRTWFDWDEVERPGLGHADRLAWLMTRGLLMGRARRGDYVPVALPEDPEAGDLDAELWPVLAWER